MKSSPRPAPVELDMRVMIRRITVIARPSASPPRDEHEATGSLLSAARSAAAPARSSA